MAEEGAAGPRDVLTQARLRPWLDPRGDLPARARFRLSADGSWIAAATDVLTAVVEDDGAGR